MTPVFDPTRPATYSHACEKALDVPLLCTYPRSGSHWLRMILERITDRPTVPRAFLCHPCNNPILRHLHDRTFRYRRTDQPAVILFRHPLPTMYSYVVYRKWGVRSVRDADLFRQVNRMKRWLNKWVNQAPPSKQYMRMRYEELVKYPSEYVSRVLAFLPTTQDRPWSASEIEAAVREFSVERVSKLATWNKRVISLRTDKARRRKDFIQRRGEEIMARLGDAWAFEEYQDEPC